MKEDNPEWFSVGKKQQDCLLLYVVKSLQIKQHRSKGGKKPQMKKNQEKPRYAFRYFKPVFQSTMFMNTKCYLLMLNKMPKNQA